MSISFRTDEKRESGGRIPRTEVAADVGIAERFARHPHNVAQVRGSSSLVTDTTGDVAATRTESTAKILLVDDLPANLLSLEAMLGDMNVNLIRAASGADALRNLLHDDFALILMDVQMPGMDGFETAELIRQRERSQSTPIIFLTGVESAESQIFKGYSLGAVDYLVKPIVPDVLRSKVSVFVEIFRKTEQVKKQAELLRDLEQREHERKLSEAKAQWESERLRQEIHLARQIQQKLFPAAPLPIPGWDIAGASFPAEATGGDYFDYIPMQDGSLAAVIADVSGHGFGPALLMAELRAYLRAFLLTRTDVSEIVRLLNRALTADTDEGHFATLFLGKLDTVTRSFVYASAGHSSGFVLDPAGNVRAELHSTDIPLGIRPDGEFRAEPIMTLEPGETVVLFTDGIVEACDSDDRFFGAEGVLRVVKENRHLAARDIVNALFGAVHGMCGPATQIDDMTAIVIKAE
jgi:serine phosphatase RsbU (regulator of sigma subunit)